MASRRCQNCRLRSTHLPLDDVADDSCKPNSSIQTKTSDGNTAANLMCPGCWNRFAGCGGGDANLASDRIFPTGLAQISNSRDNKYACLKSKFGCRRENGWTCSSRPSRPVSSGLICWKSGASDMSWNFSAKQRKLTALLFGLLRPVLPHGRNARLGSKSPARDGVASWPTAECGFLIDRSLINAR